MNARKYYILCDYFYCSQSQFNWSFSNHISQQDCQVFEQFFCYNYSRMISKTCLPFLEVLFTLNALSGHCSRSQLQRYSVTNIMVYKTIHAKVDWNFYHLVAPWMKWIVCCKIFSRKKKHEENFVNRRLRNKIDHPFSGIDFKLKNEIHSSRWSLLKNWIYCFARKFLMLPNTLNWICQVYKVTLKP